MTTLKKKQRHLTAFNETSAERYLMNLGPNDNAMMTDVGQLFQDKGNWNQSVHQFIWSYQKPLNYEEVLLKVFKLKFIYLKRLNAKAM